LKKINNITIIGSGNVGTEFGKKLFQAKFTIDGIYGYRLESGKSLAKETSSKFFSNKKDIPKNSDLYLIALKDDLYIETLKDINLQGKLIIHTSGSLDSNDLNVFSNRWGCIYPLQSISKNQKVNWNSFKSYIEASNAKDENSLMELCRALKLNFARANSNQRKKIHLTAVASNNFTYHLLSSIREFCEKNKLEYHDFKNLLSQSIENSFREKVFQLQTGPAKRKDLKLIETQIKMVEDNKNFKEIYELFTDQILNKHHEL
jgi:predicted short-subunit dehydrogenase-like oxidoreductase (DUF2520 family)